MGLLIQVLTSFRTHISNYFRAFSRTKWFCSLAVAFIMVLLSSNNAHAIGVGAAESDSYIGERLSVRIPLFNVANPNALVINFSSPQFGQEGQSVVRAELDRSNSQLAIKLISNAVINEPYLYFNLELIDGGVVLAKEFTVLLNLAPKSQVVEVENSFTNLSVSDLPNVVNNTPRQIASGDLMGPYEYAQSGNIPAKFGAVLDGQSLWRVARRINGAMGVSRSQMIWALYQANPSAFTSRSVQSLKAGSFLDIPSEGIVKQTSHEQAKANLRALSNGGAAAVVAGPDGSGSLAEFAPTDSSSKAESEGLNEPQKVDPFQVASVSQLGSQLSEGASQQAQEIIASLTETVGNLSQQLVRKDSQIESLEAQVQELKSFISEDAALDAINGSDALIAQGELSNEGSLSAEDSLPAEDSLSAEDSLPAEGSLSVEDPLPSEGSEGSEVLKSVVTESSSNSALENATTESTVAPEQTPLVEKVRPFWVWLVGALGVLLLVALLMRRRIAELWASLNLFGSNERVEFTDPSVAEMPKVYSRDQAAFGSEPETHFEPSKVASGDGKPRDYSELVAVEKTDDENVLAGISLDEHDDDGSFEPNEVLEFVTEDAEKESIDEEDLSFEERFNYLLDEKDFDFARELLDFARYNEINDERYHFERLRLFEKMGDEEEFYQYYYEIEDKIPAFPATVQTEISQLVVKIAHN